MVFKYKIPEDLTEQEINKRAQEERINILNEHTFLTFIGASCAYEAEDELKQIKTLLLTFDDPD